MEGYYKVKLRKGTKKGFDKWSDKSTWTKTIDLNKHNGAILTGRVNNLIVLDVDVKKKEDDFKADGITEFDKYISEHGEPLTYKVKTPSGGYHYYFTHKHSDITAFTIIMDNLKNASGYRNAGLDIRTDGGLIIMAGSCVDNVGYYEVVRDVSPIEFPLTLLEWLTDAEANGKPTGEDNITIKKSHKTCYTVDRDYVYYDLTDEKIQQVLDLLPTKYVSNYSDWLKVMTVMKHHNKKKLWDKFSKGSYHYNKAENFRMWDRNKGIFNINYLVAIVRSAGHQIPFFKRYKKYEPITKSMNDINTISCNNKFISDSFTYDLFESILQSSTGTGKTTAVATHIAKMRQPTFNLLTITTRTTLCDQHITTFGDAGLKLAHYQKCPKLLNAECLTICLNSLHKLKSLTIRDIEETIIYIDEVKAFLEFTHNKTLDHNLQDTTELLMKLIKHAKKVIVSDAIIDDNVFEFLKRRQNIIFVNNSYQKYQDIEAIRLRSEYDFRDALVKHCKEQKPFLFGCDSKDTVSSLFHYCKKHVSEEYYHKFLLITDEYKEPLENANELFKDKFVFYSPKITFGIDFSIMDKQNVFIYIKGGSIQPHGMFQQATRCRNIDKLYYYGEVNEYPYIYHDLEQAREDIRNGAKMTEEFKEACSYIDENDERRIVENTFFNLFCYNEYVIDCYKTNKLKHFELILSNSGFKLSEVGEADRIQPQAKKDMRSVVQSIKEDLFNEYLEDTQKDKEKYDQINANLKYLKLRNADDLKMYKDIIIDKYLIEEHDNIIRLFKTDEFIKQKLTQFINTAYDGSVIMCVFNKIKLIRQIERDYNIQLFNLPNICRDIEMADEFYKQIKTVFKTTKGKPTNMNDLVKLYVGLIRNIAGGTLMKSKKLNTKAQRDNIVYSLDLKVLHYHLELNSLKNKQMKDFIDVLNIDKYKKACEVYEEGEVNFISADDDIYD